MRTPGIFQLLPVLVARQSGTGLRLTCTRYPGWLIYVVSFIGG